MTGADGALEWANAACLAMSPGSDTWPPPPLFDTALLPQATAEGASARVPLGTDETPRHWFEVHARRAGARTLYAAANADAAVRAERNLRDFTQTLTKTFAHLTIGLAIFDQKRRLILFNPALVDMTGLEPQILTARPTLVGFLDRLRERRIIPEPKDYASWRRKMAELEAAAVDGSYGETWSLPTGQTYRVTGRPHPDGAVIFLFEDISAEISLTRRFRTELEMGQSVIDSLEESVAVFTPGGVLAMTNASYVALWGHDPDSGLAEVSVGDATALWLARSAPSPAWGDFRDFARQGPARAEWTADVTLRDGRPLACRFVPLSGGGTLAAFRILKADDLRTEVQRRQIA
jgi:PAS domain-containing protein